VKKKDYYGHILEKHQQKVLKILEKNFKEQKQGPLKKAKPFVDPTAGLKNSKGVIAHYGETGKLYCGNKMDERCLCCDGGCGPDNGCNCESCMELEKKVLRLPSYYLINRDNRISHFEN